MHIHFLLTIFIFYCIISCGVSNEEIVLKRYENGKPSMTKKINDSSDTSSYELKAYYETGELFSNCYYKNSKMNGDLLEYHKNGKIKLDSKVINDRFIGSKKRFYENGKLQSIDSLLTNDCKPMDCCCDAIITEFNENGDTIEFHTRINEVRHGYSFRVFENGQRREGNFVNGEMEGIFKTYYSNGVLKINTYKNSILNGPTIEYTETQTIFGQYSNGKETGQWLIKDKKGKLVRIDNYVEGQFKSSSKK
jgi:antitoxin component YwqK of YwqJK toxin-antitoxin module